MSLFFLDSNVLSELWKAAPDRNVLSWMEVAEWFVPVPVIAEIQAGAEASPSEKQRQEINQKLEEFLAAHQGLVVPWDADTARLWGRLRYSREVKNQPQALWDSLIDALACRYDATVATRNIDDFRHASTFNPWTHKHVDQ